MTLTFAYLIYSFGARYVPVPLRRLTDVGKSGPELLPLLPAKVCMRVLGGLFARAAAAEEIGAPLSCGRALPGALVRPGLKCCPPDAAECWEHELGS